MMKKAIVLAMALFIWAQMGFGGTLAIGNGSGASSITATSAWLQVTVTSTNTVNPYLFALWGLTNGSTNAATWQYTNTFGKSTQGTYSCQVAALNANTLYYYRGYATNSATTDVTWASSCIIWRTLSTATSAPVTSVSTVTVNTNGVLKSPSNFLVTNNIATNTTTYQADSITANSGTFSNDLYTLRTNYLFYLNANYYVARWASTSTVWYIQGCSNGTKSAIVTNAFSF